MENLRIEINYVIMMSRMNLKLYLASVSLINISKTSFDNVINKLKSNSWIMETDSGYHYLNIIKMKIYKEEL